MSKREPAIVKAERLRAVMSMPEYGSTIGAWISEAETAALHDMTEAKEPHEFHNAQGAYKAVRSIREQFDRVFAAEAAAIDAASKKQVKNKDDSV